MSDGYKHILDVWETPETGGIFEGLQKLDVPWKTLNISQTLDLEYYYNHSGQKIISPLVRSQLTSDVIDTAHNDKIASMLFTICNDNWKKLYEAMTIDYSPIENVDAYMTETTDTTGSGSHSETQKDTGTDNHSKTGTETLKQTGTDTSTKTGTDKIDGKFSETTYHNEYTSDVNKNPGGTSETVTGVAGFNSDNYSDADKTTTTVKQEITTLHRTLSVQLDAKGNPIKDESGKEIADPDRNSDKTENTHEDTTTYNTTDTETIDKTDSTNYNVNDDETLDLQHTTEGSDSSTGKETHDLHRHGNIGVTTNQQMITEEITLRKNFFFEEVFSDVDRYLTLNIY